MRNIYYHNVNRFISIFPFMFYTLELVYCLLSPLVVLVFLSNMVK